MVEYILPFYKEVKKWFILVISLKQKAMLIKD
jgi:hypothetical protein